VLGVLKDHESDGDGELLGEPVGQRSESGGSYSMLRVFWEMLMTNSFSPSQQLSIKAMVLMMYWMLLGMVTMVRESLCFLWMVRTDSRRSKMFL
jgi:hypothetical protein